MMIQSLPSLANVFVPSQGPVFTDVRVVEVSGMAQVQVKVVG